VSLASGPRLAALLVLAACVLLAAVQPPALLPLRQALFDACQRLAPRERISAPVVIVAIDEHALHEHGQWPWPRTLTAELVRAIAQGKPAAIGVDIVFSEPDRSSPEADAALARAIQGNKVVLGIAALEGRERRTPQPPQAAPVKIAPGGEPALRRFESSLQNRPELERAAAGRGLLNVDSGERGVRQVPLAARVSGTVVPALSIEMLRIAAGVSFLGLARDRLTIGDLAIPVEPDGSMWLHYGRHDAERFVSAADVLAGKVKPGTFDSKLVLVGVTGLGLLDFKGTPLGERIAGVEVHAQLLEQVFDGRFLRRVAGARWIEPLLLAAVGLLLVLAVPAVRAWHAAAILLAALAALAAAGIALFRAGWLLDVAIPVLGALAVFGAVMAGTLAEAQRQRQALREAQARLAGELEAARRIQVGLLPDPRQVFAGEPRIDLAARLVPARTVGGDFYDCFMLDAHRLFFVVADVSGKGLAPSLFMALAKSLLKSIALRGGDDPGTILMRANAEIARDNKESLFITAFAGVLDLRTGTLAFCNAGHEPPYARRPGAQPERLEHPGGPPLCVMEDYEYPSALRQMAAGETLAVVTDGITEAMNSRGELYGAARLVAQLAVLSDAALPEETLAAVDADVRRFGAGAEQYDDITMLCLRWKGPGEARAAGATLADVGRRAVPQP
jgi:CHASE2 domain-containing sensor protein